MLPFFNHHKVYKVTESQWRGNYYMGGGARPRAPKSGTQNKVLRWNWSVFYPKNKRSL